MKRHLYPFLLVAGACAGALAACGAPVDDEAASLAEAVITPPSNLPVPLERVPVPEPPDLAEYVADKAAAIALGKALFWDMQLGSDGKTACATCHFHAGADSRTRNQVAPGLLVRDGQYMPTPDTAVSLGGLNYRLRKNDFPLRKLADVNDRNSAVLRDTNDIVSSQGVTYGLFRGLRAGDSKDDVEVAPDTDGFRVGSTNVRRVEPRNTPTVINAVFYTRQFWDGRAQDEFNGVNLWGARDPFAFVYKADPGGKAASAVRVRIRNASLASQAVAPPLSSFEMSADGRTFLEIGDRIQRDKACTAKGRKLLRQAGRKLTGLAPLAKQIVAKDDSVLGPLSKSPERGLRGSYEAMVRRAFQPAWWKADVLVEVNPTTGERAVVARTGRPGPNQYTLLEYNFSLFFGLAIQLYEATLVSGDTPFDRYVKGDRAALTTQQQEGMVLFFDTVRVRCVNCHGGPELSDATHTTAGPKPLRRRDGNLIDRGFNNIGVRPTVEDIGNGEVDPWGVPLSLARMATQGLFSDPTVSPPVGAVESLGDDGAFKAPTLRNIELTAPYFHNGGALTLRQVIDFYSRGGDFQPNVNRAGQVVAPVATLNLTEAEKNALVAFLMGLTDERVRWHRAPFDHPELRVPNGHGGDTTTVTVRSNGQPKDRTRTVPAVGAAGLPKLLPNFLEKDTDDDGPDEE